MTFKQFKRWCNDRACDGCWGSEEAAFCIDLISDMMKIPWWKRNKVWKKIEIKVIHVIVTPTNQKRQEMAAKAGDGNG